MVVVSSVLVVIAVRGSGSAQHVVVVVAVGDAAATAAVVSEVWVSVSSLGGLIEMYFPLAISESQYIGRVYRNGMFGFLCVLLDRVVVHHSSSLIIFKD